MAGEPKSTSESYVLRLVSGDTVTNLFRTAPDDVEAKRLILTELAAQIVSAGEAAIFTRDGRLIWSSQRRGRGFPPVTGPVARS